MKKKSTTLNPHTLVREGRAKRVYNPFVQAAGRAFVYGATFALGMFCIIWLVETLGL